MLTCSQRWCKFAGSAPGRKIRDKDVEKEMGMLLSQSLEGSLHLRSFPKSLLDIYALVLQDDGGALGAACTGCSLALADAGIEMYDLVAACSVAKVICHIIL